MASDTVRTQEDKVRTPRSGMASTALMHRFTSTWWIWEGSPSTVGQSVMATTTWRSWLMDGLIMARQSSTMAGRSRGSTLFLPRRPKARSFWVSSAEREAAARMAFRYFWRIGSPSPPRRRSA